MNKKVLLLAFWLLVLSGLAGFPAHAERVWWDGSRDAEDAPPGKLLSDNSGYWGDSVLTGVDYRYETEPNSPADIVASDAATFGRRLLNGVPMGDWYVPVGLSNSPIVVVFDFKRVCTFSEIDVVTQSNKVTLKIEIGDAGQGPWRLAFERPLDQSPDRNFHRVPLTQRPKGQFLRLTVDAQIPGQQPTTFLNEVIAWGDAQITPETPEAFNPVAPTPVIAGIAFPSIPGADKSSFSDAQFWEWERNMGKLLDPPAVWSQVPTWDNITNRPILPGAAQINRPVSLAMARNETECAAIALTNTTMTEPLDLEVKLGAFKPVGKTPPIRTATVSQISGELRVAGTVPTRTFGVGISPLLSADNKLDDGMMRRYLTNAAGIENFPRLKLSPAGSAVLWLSVQTQGVAPGVYEAQLSYQTVGKNRKSGRASLPVRVEVLDVTLPNPAVWVQTYSGTTTMFPFEYGDRAIREVDYKQSLGVTVWHELPEPNSIAALARKRGRAIHHIYILPRRFIEGGYNATLKPEQLTEKDATEITEYVKETVKHTRELGLTYNDWYGELWDEPGAGNAAIFEALARIVKKADPQVRLYCNPLFWYGENVAGDDIAYPALQPWYRELVDISAPIELLLFNRPKLQPLFDAPRDINAFYTVSTHVTRGEQAAHVERYRRLAWQAFSRGWDGWGFYAYYAPLGSPWNDLDGVQNLPDYTMVYPGPRGPIPTRQSESLREGWEDYRLLSLLKERGRKAELDAILKAYAAGQSPQTLRLQALRAAANDNKKPLPPKK